MSQDPYVSPLEFYCLIFEFRFFSWFKLCLFNKPCLERQLMFCPIEGNLRHILRDTIKLKDDSPWFYGENIVVNGAFSFTHSHLWGFGRYRLIWENPNPHPSFTLKVVSDSPTCSLNLP